MDREDLLAAVTQYSCSQNCFGSRGHHGGCCAVGERDWIIGPVADADAFLERLSQHLRRPVPAQEALLKFEEGSKLFPNRSTWQEPKNFPALRLNPSHSWNLCKYYDPNLKGCSIHALRPQLCRDYYCDHLKGLFKLL